MNEARRSSALAFGCTRSIACSHTFACVQQSAKIAQTSSDHAAYDQVFPIGRTQDSVDLVDEQDDAAVGVRHLLDDGLPRQKRGSSCRSKLHVFQATQAAPELDWTAGLKVVELHSHAQKATDCCPWILE